MKKRLYIIPGFNETTREKAYLQIKKIATRKGYDVFPINISWKYKTGSDWLEEARGKILKDNNKEIDSSILGFSFGALIAIELSKEFQFNNMYICSLSPYYSEDLKFIPKSATSWLGKRRINDFKKKTFNPNNSTKATFMVGDSEWDFAKDKIKERYNKWGGPKSLKIIKGSDHYIGNSAYLKQIEKEI